MRAVEERLRASADAVLLGRLTFESFREYWPNQTDDTTGVSDYLNQVKKYVVSSTLTDPGWAHTTILAATWPTRLPRSRHNPAATCRTGSITLVHTLSHGLVDEYRLFVYPSVGPGTTAVRRTGRPTRT